MRYTAIKLCVLPHSEISGSKLICSSPKLIAACHVLLRLLMPRHSPCALISFTYTVFDLQHGSLRIMQVQQKLFNKIVSLPLIKSFPQLLFLKCDPLGSRPLLPCLLLLLSVQFSRCKFRCRGMVENSGIEPLTS